MTNALLEESTPLRAEDCPKVEWDEAEVARILKLLPRDVARWWDLVVQAIRSTQPEITPDAINMLLSATMSGVYQCWILYDRESTMGFVFTTRTLDSFTGVISMLVYQIYTFKDASYGVLRLIFGQLKKYARADGCSMIVCQVSNPEVIAVFSEMGANTKTTLVALEV